MAAAACTNPPVLIALLAGDTQRIRVGSGGVLLPNHTPLVIAEQFALLEAAHPGRIDLGIGRATGADPATSRFLGRGSGSVDELRAFVDGTGARPSAAGHGGLPTATPRAASTPPLWLLGASEGSARLAAEKGLSYVFGHHLGAEGAGEALQAYRSAFRPSRDLAEPRTLLPVMASVADTSEEARRAALPWLLVMLGLHTGRPQTPVLTIEEAERAPISPDDQRLLDALAQRYVIGTADEARDHIQHLASTFAVDEVMINPIAGAHEGDDPRTDPGRVQTLRLLAAQQARS
jgi:luciferase family oxidoreductase group 1